MKQPRERQRALLEEKVEERAAHSTDEQVRTTYSLARGERLLGREYHGRFLIELLQNAADAWREDPRAVDSRSRLAIVVTDEPALLVANQGLPLTAEVVINVLGHIGASTKPEGAAIGHKGVGFKSVLELTSCPEAYSRLRSTEERLAVRFDPHVALRRIQKASPQWDRMVAEADNAEHHDQLAAVPVLRYPLWVDTPPDEVNKLADAGFDTVVRLPYVDQGPVSRDEWAAAVRGAIDGLSDQIVLLLDGFSEVSIVDHAEHRTIHIRPEFLEPSGRSQPIEVHRTDRRTSSWRLYRDRTNTDMDLASELVVGIRLDTRDGAVITAAPSLEVVAGDEQPAGDDGPGAPFHLFFPTRIVSGTPFLLHAYFEVDASRTGFYAGSWRRNEELLSSLARLAAAAVADLVAERPQLARSLVNQVAACPTPEESLARRFHTQLLDRLDEMAWIPTDVPTGTMLVRPAQVLVLDELHRPAMEAFPADYVTRRLGLHPPDSGLDQAALTLLRNRQGDQQQEQFEVLGELLRPGPLEVWEPTEAVDGFKRLLDLLDSMAAVDRDRMDSLLGGLRGDEAARLVPTVQDGTIELRPCADPGVGRSGARSRVVMGRVRNPDQPLTPPAALDIDFLPDGSLPEAALERARPLGVRPFTVDSVLDRLSDLDPEAGGHAEMLTFLWRLLVRERQSSFSVAETVPTAAIFDPTSLFWCQPGRARDTDTGAPRQRRERNLTRVPVPCRDRSWRPAGQVVLGEDWADWLERHAVGAEPHRIRRIAALRALATLAPDDGQLLAPPDEVADLLELSQAPHHADAHDDEPLELRLLAFLLRLGVWQTVPIDAWDNRAQEGREPFPWDDEVSQWRHDLVAGRGGWIFTSRPGRPHDNVWVAEDYRMRWSLEAAAERDTSALLTLLHLSVPPLTRAMKARVFCTGCRDDEGGHRSRHESGPDEPFPSHLAVELGRRCWLPAVQGGVSVGGLRSANTIWWGPEPLGTSVVKQHPERFLERTDPELGVSRELRELVGLQRLDEASTARLGELLLELRQRFEDGGLDDTDASGLSRQAYVGLHRHIYRRLAELQPDTPDAVADVVAAAGILCERGSVLEHLPPAQARHDDGTHTAHLRHLPDEVARAILSRDAEMVARRLGIPTLKLRFHRRGDDGCDVTAELEATYHERIPELLAVLVHHSLGAQTLEPTSRQFEERARRLHNLRVRQVDNLDLDIEVVDTGLQLTLGEEVATFLDGGNTNVPVLYHDLRSVDWQEELRPHLARHVAAMVDNVAYEHTFELFFNRTTNNDREDFLLSLGVRPEEVDRLRERVGAANETALAQRRRWFAAILKCLQPDGLTDPDTIDLGTVAEALVDGGLAAETAALLADHGGGAHDRRDASGQGALRLLATAGVDLTELDAALRQLDDEGLTLRVAAERFNRWRDQHRWPLIGLLAPRVGGPAQARRRVQALQAPDSLRLALDPPWTELLKPIVDELESAGITPRLGHLAGDPDEELARAGGFSTVEEMHSAIRLWVDQDTYERELRERATRWRALLLDIGVLARLTPSMTRTSIRTVTEQVSATLPEHPARPSELWSCLPQALGAASELASALASLLTDDLTVPPPTIEALADRLGDLPLDRLGDMRAARARPRHAIERLQRRCDELTDAGISPATPRGLQQRLRREQRVDDDPAPRSRPVNVVRVDPGVDQRKREIGDDAEQWALAASLAPLLVLPPAVLETALDSLAALIQRHFHGRAVDQLLGHVQRAKLAGDDGEAFVEHVTQFLHASRISDAFGFDVLAWLPPASDENPTALLLEVKGTSQGSFHLSTGEWGRARQLYQAGDGNHYAVLAVARAANGGPPARMDLLCDPVALVEQGYLTRAADGYKVSYTTGT